MTIIDKIKAEFQKRFEKCQSVSEDERNALDVQDYYRGKYTAYSEAISFINMLLQEQEKEQHSEDLEVAAEKFAHFYDNGTCDGIAQDCFKAGAEWGEKNAYKAIMKKADEVRDKRFDTDYEIKIEPAAGFDFGCINVYREGKLVGQYVEPKEEKKLPEDLEEAAKKYDEAESWRWEAPKYPRKDAFKAGAKWKKEQMMKEAVEGYVTYGSKGAYVVSDWLGTYDVEVFGPNCSKVKIIIVKEEEK